MTTTVVGAADSCGAGGMAVVVGAAESAAGSSEGGA